MAYLQDVQESVPALPEAGNLTSFVVLSQNENGRKLLFKIVGIDIPSGSTATFSGTKPDGVVYSTTGEISGNVVTVNEDTQMTAVAGSWDAKIRILNGGNVIASAKVRMTIDADPVAPGSIPSDSQLDGIVAECQAYAESARSDAYGSPLTASTAAGMIDKTRVYVYTGSETGYTNGHWYYWDGSAWTDGGTYNSSGIQTDTTLSVPGMAADAKAVGDELSDVKEDLNDVEEWAGFPKNFIDARGFVSGNLNNWTISNVTKKSVTIIHNNDYSSGSPTLELNLQSGEYLFEADFSDSSVSFLGFYADGVYIDIIRSGDTITIDSTKTNIFTFPSSATGTNVISDMSLTKADIHGEIPAIEMRVTSLESCCADIATLYTGEIYGTETEKSAINSNGSIYTAGSTNYRTIKYDVSSGKKYLITANTNWGNLLWCFYDSNNVVVQLGQASASESSDTIITDFETVAPERAVYLVIAYNSTVASGMAKVKDGYKLKGKWTGKKWVCVGDSLTAENIRTTKHYFDYVAEETGITTVNMGDSGSGYAREQDVGTAFYQRIGNCPTDADVVTIFGSFNDLGAGLPIGSVDDTGTTTLAGCINTTIDNLQAVIPLVNLGIAAPTPWNTTQPSTSGDAYNYVEMLKAICERRSIPFLDLWRCSNLRPWDADFRALAYSKDDGNGTHPDENGHKLIAPRFKGFLETLLL